MGAMLLALYAAVVALAALSAHAGLIPLAILGVLMMGLLVLRAHVRPARR